MERGRMADPAALPLGTQVGSWRIVSQQGSGSYGIVYRVERVGQEEAGPFALKVARRLLDPRFEREWVLLSRIRHAHVPRFEVQGWVTLPGGVPYPYVVMEWVEGTSLYEWGAREPRTSRQVMRVLAQVARALEATHAVEGVHRDVKGDNVLVRTKDGTAVLMDFGSGNFRGAPVLTRQPPPPGTDRYWSPECLRAQMKWLRQPAMRYEAGPADDLYALGVMAYRLVTGVYPPPGVDFVVTEEDIQSFEPEPVPAETRVRLSPELAALIAQLLAKEPTARGTAAQVAQALERAADTAGPEADQPIVPVSAPAPTESKPPLPTQLPVEHKPPPVSLRGIPAWAPWSAVSLGMLLVLGAWWIAHRPSGDELGAVTENGPRSGTESGGGKGDAEPVGLGDTGRSASTTEAPPESARGGIRKVLPDKPLPGQRLPPCEKPEIELNGGCWVHWADMSPPCRGRFYEWKGKCYLAPLEPTRPPTSDPP
jgi:serine/threonine protein kinase